MTKTKRIISVTAGRLVFEVCYTQILASDSAAARAAKSKCSNAARQKMNFRASYQKLQLLLAANFTRRDLYITLTYDDEHLPKNRNAAQKLMAKFLAQMRKTRGVTGDILKYVYATHEMLDDGTRRLHHHLVTNAGADRHDFETVRALWTYGDNIDISEIGDTEYYCRDDFLELAYYLAREKNPDAVIGTVGSRGWTSSLNLEKPVRKSYLVDANITVTAPPGAFVLDTDEKQNEFGYYKYIKYLLPEKPRRTRKKRIASIFSV